MALRAGECGVVVPGVTSIGMKVVVARREAIVARARIGVDGSLQKDHGITVFTGTAEFASPNTGRVGEDVLDAEQKMSRRVCGGPVFQICRYPRRRAKATHLGSSNRTAQSTFGGQY
jgi:hypothetical protein